jgi:hypothetical protein
MPTPAQREQVVIPAGQTGPRYGIHNLLQARHDRNQGDGLQPQQRAEGLLQMFLGGSYDTLNQQGYLDVSSSRPQEALDYLRNLRGLYFDGLPRAASELVYRIPIDHRRQSDRRVRVWMDGRYICDLCIVRDYSARVPVADAFLGLYMGFMANELHMLKIVGGGNVFGKKSDSEDAPGPRPTYALPARAA